jgi:hypothetical protein
MQQIVRIAIEGTDVCVFPGKRRNHAAGIEQSADAFVIEGLRCMLQFNQAVAEGEVSRLGVRHRDSGNTSECVI